MRTEEPQPSHIKKEEEYPLFTHFKEEEEDPLTPHIKEEEEEHSISQQGEHLEGLEEVDVTKMPVTGVPVKSEDDEVKGESEEKREAEPPSSSSTQHMTTEADGDHCGGSQADKILAPLSDSEDTTSHSPDTDDEDSKDDKTCHTDNTHFTCSLCDKTFKYPRWRPRRPPGSPVRKAGPGSRPPMLRLFGFKPVDAAEGIFLSLCHDVDLGDANYCVGCFPKMQTN
nr:uncharacterized protein LOC133570684 [Nerophis lumbriciformis]